jgi:FkbM family methyltransferase
MEMPAIPNLHMLRWKLRRVGAALLRSPILASYRLLAWQVQRWLRRSPVVVSLPRWALRLVLPTDWPVGATMIYVFREQYEPELALLQRFLQPGAVAIDAGANLGIYTAVTARLVGATGRVYAFEPGERAHALLRENLALNGLDQVETFTTALSDRQGSARLYAHTWGPVSFSLGNIQQALQGFEIVPTTTLDLFAQEHRLDRLDFLKIDVEGAEELVLAGGRELIARTRPVVLFEVSARLPTFLGLSPTGAWDWLAAFGYTFHAVERAAGLVEIARLPEDGNVIALYCEKK